MLWNALNHVRNAGAGLERVAEGDRGVDAVVSITFGEASARFALLVKGRTPFPNEMLRLDPRIAALRSEGQPTLIVPFVSEALGSRLTDAGWSWADAEGNFDLRAPGLVLRQRRTAVPPKSRSKTLPQGSGSLAIIRALIGFAGDEEEEPSATALAAQANVTQPRASQVLRRLLDLDLVERSSRGRWHPKREALLDRFLSEYAGPRGFEAHKYSLDAPAVVARAAAGMHRPDEPILVSADVGPDLVAPWRRPTKVILYVRHEDALDGLPLVEAESPNAANVFIRVPDDESIFSVRPELTVADRDVVVQTADPVQMMWDLQDLGGEDRREAAGVLREWLLSR